MNFIDLDKEHILKHSKLVEDKFYEFELGKPVQVTATKSKHINNLVADNLSSKTDTDMFMIRYEPTNKIYFDRQVIEDTQSTGNYISCFIDEKTSRIIIGKPEKYPIKTGVLTFSGNLSMNNLVETQKMILGNSKTIATIKDRAKVLAIGLKDGDLFGLYHIGDANGLAVSIPKTDNKGISTKTLKVKDCSDYIGFTLEDWFEGTRIIEKEAY